MADRWNKFFGKNPVPRAGLLHLNNRKERILSLDEEKRLLSACDTYIRNIIITALYTGLRKSEIISLKWEDVDFNSGIITIDQTNAKSKKARRIPINSSRKVITLSAKVKDRRERVHIP
ncbi:MAG: tyrosine-type recombinase/integrase [Thermodesulfobacteriota bacterium]